MSDFGPGHQIVHALQVLVGLAFVFAVLPKVRRPTEFIRTVVAYEVVPKKPAQALAVLLIPFEAGVAISFVTGALIDITIPIAAALLAAFAAAVGANLARGRKIACGCFGVSSETVSVRSLLRIAMLLLIVSVVAMTYRNGFAAFSVVSVFDEASTAAVYEVAVLSLAGVLLVVGVWVMQGRETAYFLRRAISASPKGGHRSTELVMEDAR